MNKKTEGTGGTKAIGQGRRGKQSIVEHFERQRAGSVGALPHMELQKRKREEEEEQERLKAEEAFFEKFKKARKVNRTPPGKEKNSAEKVEEAEMEKLDEILKTLR